MYFREFQPRCNMRDFALILKKGKRRNGEKISKNYANPILPVRIKSLKRGENP